MSFTVDVIKVGFSVCCRLMLTRDLVELEEQVQGKKSISFVQTFSLIDETFYQKSLSCPPHHAGNAIDCTRSLPTRMRC